MNIGVWVVVAAVILIVLYWILANTAVVQPPPPMPDADTRRLVNDFYSYPTEVWFRDSQCFFKKYLSCKNYRYIIYTSGGEVVYDSRPHYPYTESAKSIRNSYEYIKAISTTEGAAIRGNVVNTCFLAKIGNRYRIVHISEYIYREGDYGY